MEDTSQKWLLSLILTDFKPRQPIIYLIMEAVIHK